MERARLEERARDDLAASDAAELEAQKPDYFAFKERTYGQAIDFNVAADDGELRSALKAYDAMYWIFTGQGRWPGKALSMSYNAAKFLQQPLPNPGQRISRDKIMEVSCIDWCVQHAFGASADIIGKVSTYVNSQILVSALLMSVTAPLFISPPEFENDWFQIIVSAVLGLSTFFQLFNLVAFTAVLNMINAPYTAAYTMLARVEAEFYLWFLNILVYAGVCMFMAAMLFVAYVGNIIDLYIMTPVVGLLILFGYLLYITSVTGMEFRRESTFQFYERCVHTPPPSTTTTIHTYTRTCIHARLTPTPSSSFQKNTKKGIASTTASFAQSFWTWCILNTRRWRLGGLLTAAAAATATTVRA